MIHRASPTTFANVYRIARPGDTIRLAPGNYGHLVLSREFPEDTPLTIQAKTPGGAKCTIGGLGTGHVLRGLTDDRNDEHEIEGRLVVERGRHLVIKIGDKELSSWLAEKLDIPITADGALTQGTYDRVTLKLKRHKA